MKYIYICNSSGTPKIPLHRDSLQLPKLKEAQESNRYRATFSENSDNTYFPSLSLLCANFLHSNVRIRHKIRGLRHQIRGLIDHSFCGFLAGQHMVRQRVRRRAQGAPVSQVPDSQAIKDEEGRAF
jgi:hypothetical protein